MNITTQEKQKIEKLNNSETYTTKNEKDEELDIDFSDIQIEESLPADDFDDWDFGNADDSSASTRGEQSIRKPYLNTNKEIDYAKLKFVLGAIAALAIFTIYFISR